MADYLTNTTELTAVADAIREKTGESGDLIYPNGFVDAIGEISGGIGARNVSINNVDGYAPIDIYYVDENMSVQHNTDSFLDAFVPIGTLICCYGCNGPAPSSDSGVTGVNPIYVSASVKSLIAIYQVIE